MADRVPSDHDAVETVRASLERTGGVDRPKVVCPADLSLPEGILRLVLDGRTCHARARTDRDGRPEIRGAFDSPTLARAPGEGRNRLEEWVETAGVRVGGPVLLDVVTEGYQYGLRTPGERAVYDAADPPDGSLSGIAERLGDG